MASDSILSFLVTSAVIFTPPSAIAKESVACANGSTSYEVILPVVGSEEDPVTTWRFVETTQLESIVWSGFPKRYPQQYYVAPHRSGAERRR